MSILAIILCYGIPFGLLQFLPAHPPPMDLLKWLLLAVAPACALFVVRGYTITPDAILVHRLFWSTRLPRVGLQSATAEPKVMRKSIRTCGNGGFFHSPGFIGTKNWERSVRMSPI
jgi:hypothetical protein